MLKKINLYEGKVLIIRVYKKEKNFENKLSVLSMIILSGSTLKEIYISNCSLNEIQSRDIHKMISRCGEIEKIDFSFNEDMKHGILSICEGLATLMNTLAKIDFSRYNINENQSKDLGKLLTNSNKMLKELKPKILWLE